MCGLGRARAAPISMNIPRESAVPATRGAAPAPHGRHPLGQDECVFMQKGIRVFLSYSHDSEPHKQWVRELAHPIDEFKEIELLWDRFDLQPGADLNRYMETSIRQATHVVVVATHQYKEKAHARTGGVGAETLLLWP